MGVNAFCGIKFDIRKIIVACNRMDLRFREGLLYGGDVNVIVKCRYRSQRECLVLVIKCGQITGIM